MGDWRIFDAPDLWGQFRLALECIGTDSAEGYMRVPMRLAANKSPAPAPDDGLSHALRRPPAHAFKRLCACTATHGHTCRCTKRTRWPTFTYTQTYAR